MEHAWHRWAKAAASELAFWDSIIVGAGHNGLVCAAYLARSGWRVLVLEASETLGGLAAEREFHPGFRASVAHSAGHFSSKVARDLNLAEHGFRPGRRLPKVGLRLDGQHLILDQGCLAGVGADDASAYADFAERMGRFASALQPFWFKTMPRIGSARFKDLTIFGRIGLNLRRMGKKEFREFLRVAPLPTRDLMDEQFRDDALKAMLSWDGLLGAKLAPRSPNSAILTLLYRMAENSRGAHGIPSGGIPGLIEALRRSAQAAGAEIRCASAVRRIRVAGGAQGLAAKGVELADGEQIAAENVVSAVDPRATFLQLVGARHLDIGFANRIRRLRCDGYVAKLHLALRGLPAFRGLPRPDGRMILAPDMDAIEFAFDAAKHGACPEHPVLEIVLPSLGEASLAPPGQHVLSAHVLYVPYRLKGGWSDAARQQMRERAIDQIAQYAPRIREQIIHSELLTPADLERTFRIAGGHWHHAEFALDQLLMMRPTYEAAQYDTPIRGLHLCGAGCHPGGDLTGAPGHNAAQAMLGRGMASQRRGTAGAGALE